MIGKRLKLARKGKGLSLRRLQEEIGNQVSAQALGKYERDEMMPNSTVLITLCEVLGVSEDYFLGEAELELEEIEFRKKAITSKKEESQVQALVLSRIERYLRLEELVPAARVEWIPPQHAPFTIHAIQEAETIAERLRANWNLGLDPVTELSEFLEEHGIKVMSLALPNNVSGLTCWVRSQNQPRKIPVIVINEKESGERQRFTLVHELAHMVIRVVPELDEEKVANRVASAFLVPEPTLRQMLGSHRTQITMPELERLKPFFGVSMQAVAYRCKDLGIISPTIFKSIFMRFNRLGWRKPPYEPLQLPSERPQRFEQLCYRAYSEQAISEAKAAELLEISVQRFRERLEGEHLIRSGKNNQP